MMTSAQLREVESAADSFLQSEYNGGFIRLQELSGRIAAGMNAGTNELKQKISKKLEYYLESLTDDVFISKGVVVPKRFFFRGAQFKARPTEFEVRENILFPGARFAPFCSPEKFYDEYKIREAGKNIVVKTKMVKAAFQDFIEPALLLGRSGLIDSLAAESVENRKILLASRRIESVTVSLSAYDMTDFYREHHFHTGDAVIFTVKDWDSCEFVMEYRPASELPGASLEDEWISSLENGLLEACRNETEYQEIPGQIALGYLHAWEAGADIRQKPWLSLEEYQVQMLNIDIHKDGPDWNLVSADDVGYDAGDDFDFARDRLNREENDGEYDGYDDENDGCGHEHHHSGKCACGHHHGEEGEEEKAADTGIKPEHFSVSRGLIDSMEIILEDVHAPVNEVELIAMMQDAFSRGEDDFSVFRKNLMEYLQISFADNAQEIAFENFLEEDWEVYQEQFNMLCDEVKQPLRARLLDLTRERIDTAVNLLEHYKKSGVPESIAQDMKRIHGEVFHTLAVLSTDSQLPDDAAEQLELRVCDLEDSWDDFTGTLQERMDAEENSVED